MYDLEALARMMGADPAKVIRTIQPQKHPTSVPLTPHRPVPVTLLVPVQNGKKTLKVGAQVFLKWRTNGEAHLYGFEAGGSGFELIKDAVEGVHYRF